MESFFGGFVELASRHRVKACEVVKREDIWWEGRASVIKACIVAVRSCGLLQSFGTTLACTIGGDKRAGELNEELSRKAKGEVWCYHNLDDGIRYPRGRDAMWALYHVKG